MSLEISNSLDNSYWKRANLQKRMSRESLTAPNSGLNFTNRRFVNLVDRHLLCGSQRVFASAPTLLRNDSIRQCHDELEEANAVPMDQVVEGEKDNPIHFFLQMPLVGGLNLVTDQTPV